MAETNAVQLEEKHGPVSNQPVHQNVGPQAYVQQVPYVQGGQPPMPTMAPVAGCPPGLEYLAQLDQILMRQLLEVVELFTGWEMNNKYVLKNSMGQQIYFCKEDTDCMARQCCGPKRAFTITVADNLGQDLMRIRREFNCASAQCVCCAGCETCREEVTVEAPPGQIVGYVRQRNYCMSAVISVMDSSKQEVLMMNGPCCPIQGPCCTEDIVFPIYTADGAHEVGKITKQWAGMLREMMSDADSFGLQFPPDLDVKLKATLIGLLFLVDFMFFEKKKN